RRGSRSCSSLEVSFASTPARRPGPRATFGWNATGPEPAQQSPEPYPRPYEQVRRRFRRPNEGGGVDRWLRRCSNLPFQIPRGPKDGDLRGRDQARRDERPPDAAPHAPPDVVRVDSASGLPSEDSLLALPHLSTPQQSRRRAFALRRASARGERLSFWTIFACPLMYDCPPRELAQLWILRSRLRVICRGPAAGERRPESAKANCAEGAAALIETVGLQSESRPADAHDKPPLSRRIELSA